MRIGVVGSGRWGSLIVRDLVALGVDVVAVARSTGSRDRATSAGASLVPTVADLPPVDGVIVATPTTTHAEVVTACLDLGVPIFVEKPLTDDPGAADEIVTRGGDRVFVMDKWRYHPGVETLGHMARDGRYGPVLTIATMRHSWSHSHGDTDAVWILLPHDLSIVREILGRIPSPVFARARATGGPMAEMTAVLGPDPDCIVSISAFSPTPKRSVRVGFAGATVELFDPYADTLLVRHIGSHEEEHVPIGTEMPLTRELAAFLGHLAGGPPPRSSAAEGAEVVRLISRLRSLAGM